jgi:putative transposase
MSEEKSGMKKSRPTGEQIIGFLKQVEAGILVKDLGRKQGFSDSVLYKWRAKFGGMDVSEARRLRELEGENSKLTKLLPEAMLEIEALKVVAQGKR